MLFAGLAFLEGAMAVTTGTGAVAAPAAAGQEGVRAFDVAPQSARTGIVAFAQQAGIQVLAAAEDLRGQTVGRVRGTLTIRDALQRLLVGTDLQLVSFDGRTAVLSRRPGGRLQPLPRSRSAAPRARPVAPGAVASAPTANIPDIEPMVSPKDVIVVVGYRGSLAQAALAKREAVGLTDSIFAEDIGKFPDTNIAESFNRIPGITITRDINGQGTNVAIRGLSSNFTQVTMNGAPIAVASSGITDAQGTDRSVDLSFFPTDLFTKLTVTKSYRASDLEGGASGTIDVRTARPFDRPGSRFAYDLQARYSDGAGRWGGRGSVIASTTSDTLGILVGLSADRQETRVPGYETVGWTNPNLSITQCGATSGCNNTGGGNYTIPGVVPANAGNGLVAGTVIDQAFLLAHNPGLTIQQIDNAILPRLGGVSIADGRRDRVNGVASVEWRPSEALHVYVDAMAGYRRYAYTRTTDEWIVRNAMPIPLDMTVDRADCSRGCVATGGTFANAQFYSVGRLYDETNHYWGVNPGLEWRAGEDLSVRIRGNYARSTFRRALASVLLVTPASSGITVSYRNGGDIPSITGNVDLDDPANYVWDGGRLNLQDERRLNTTGGIRGDILWGGRQLNLRIGGNYDDTARTIAAYDNSLAWQNAVCGNDPSIFLPSPNSQPPCQGLDQPGAAPSGYPAYPGYGTGSTAGATAPISYGGSLVPTSQIPNFFVPGPDGFVVVDWNRFSTASAIDAFRASAPVTGASNTGASGGYIRERSPAAFIEVNGVEQLGENDLRFNLGLRWTHTWQTIGGLVSSPDPRNVLADGSTAPDGSRYPNRLETVYTHSNYARWLPAANVALDVGSNLVVRAAMARTMTRPDPSAQLPGVNFSSPSADVATIGNPQLAPYMSTNIDLGVELSTGEEGGLGFNAFRKAVTGFTGNRIVTEPFSALTAYGITYDTLTPTQQAAIDGRGGPGTATVQVSQPVNADGTLWVSGLEMQWVQPLDFLTSKVGIRGFGVNANATLVHQHSSGAAPAVALGVAPFTYNLTAYYERQGISVRVATSFQKGSQSAPPNQNGITQAGLFTDDYQQWDLASIFDLSTLLGGDHLPQVTLDVVNFTNARLRTYFQFPNATYTEYRPGIQFMLGIRGKF
ncbi:MAG: TonB-dependent receptor [Sphingomonas sp.]